MADKEEILVRLTVDSASIKNALTKVRDFRDKANEVVGKITVKLDTKALVSSLAAAKQKFAEFASDAAKKAVVTIKVSLSAKDIQHALKQLNMLTGKATELQTSLKNATANFNKMAASVNNVTTKLNNTQNAISKQAKAGAGGILSNLKDAALRTKELALGYEFTTRSFFGFVAAQQIGLGIIRPVIEEFTNYEDRLLRVGRLLNLSGDGLAAFGVQMTAIATQLGVGRDALLDLALAASRVGVGSKDIESFVTQTQKIAIALEIPGEQAAETFRSFQLLFKLNTGELTKVANVFNSVADASAISAQGLASFLQYLGPVANQFDLIGSKGVSSMTAIAAVLGELGISAEVAGSGMQKIFTSLTVNAKEAAKVAGVGMEQFQQLLRDDVVGAMNLVLKGYHKLDTAQKIATRSALGLTDIRVGRVFNLLAANADNLSKKMALANKSFEEGTSVEKEVAKQLTGLNSQYQQTKNAITAVVTEALLPLIATIKNYLFRLREWLTANPELAKQIASLVVTGAALLAVIGTLSVAAFGILQVFQTIINLGATIIPLMYSIGKAIFYVGEAAGSASTAVSEFFKRLIAGKAAGGAAALYTAKDLKDMKAYVKALRESGDFYKYSKVELAAMNAETLRAATATGGFSDALLKFGGRGIVFAKGAALIAAIALAIDKVQAKIRGKESLLEQYVGGSAAVGFVVDDFINGLRNIAKNMGFAVDEEDKIRKKRKATTEDTKAASKAAKDMTTAYQEYDAKAKKLVTTQDRLNFSINATKDIQNSVRDALAEGIASDDTLTFEQNLANNEEAFRKFAALSAQGGLAVREQLKSWVYLLQTEVPNAGAVTVAKFKQLQQLAKRIAPDQKEFQFALDTNDAVGNVEKLNNALLALAEKANNATAGSLERTKLMEQWARLSAAALSVAGNSAEKYSQTLKDVTRALGGNAEAAETVITAFRNMSRAFTTEQALQFAKTMRFMGGTFEQGYTDMKLLGQSVVEFRKELQAEALLKYGDAAQGLMDKLIGVGSELDFIAGIAFNRFTTEELATLGILVNKAKERIGIDSELVTLREAVVKQEDKEGAAIERNIARYVKLKRLIQEAVDARGGESTNAEKEKLKLLEKATEQETEKLNKKKQTEEIARREAKEQSRITEFVARSVELANKLSDAEEDAGAAIEKARIEEEKALRVAEARIDKAEDLVRIRVAGERNIQLAVSAAAAAQVRKAEQALTTISDKIKDLRRAGEDILARLEAEAQPARKVISDVRNELRPLIEAAEAGKFAGKEDRARYQFELKIQRLREEAENALQRQALDHIQQRAEAESKLRELAQRGRDLSFEDRQARKNEASRKAELRAQGKDYDQAEAQIQYERQQRLDERSALQRELIASEQNYADSLREGEKFFAGAGTDGALMELGRVFRQLGNEFEVALELGADNMAELEEKAALAAEQLTVAAKALRDAAEALARINTEVGSRAIAKQAIQQQVGVQAEAKTKATDLAAKTETFITTFNSTLTTLLTQLATKYSKQNTPFVDDIVKQEFQKAADEVENKLLDLVEQAEKGGIKFSDKFKESISDAVKAVQPGSIDTAAKDLKELPPRVLVATEELSVEAENIRDSYIGQAEAAQKNIEALGKVLNTAYEKIAEDAAKTKTKIEQSLLGPTAAGGTTGGTAMGGEPTEDRKPSAYVENVKREAASMSESFESAGNAVRNYLIAQEQLTQATNARKSSKGKMPTEEELRLQREVDIARSYAIIEEKVREQEAASERTTKAYKRIMTDAEELEYYSKKFAIDPNKDNVLNGPPTAAKAPPPDVQPLTPEELKRLTSVELDDRISKKMAEIARIQPKPFDLNASAQMDALIRDQQIKEGKVPYDNSDPIERLIQKIETKIDGGSGQASTSKTLPPFAIPTIPDLGRPDPTAPIVPENDLRYALNELKQGAEGAGEKLQAISEKVSDEVPVPEPVNGGVSEEAVNNATEAIGDFEGAQEENVEAVGALAESVNKLGTASTERLAGLTRKANAATADSDSALAVLQAEALV